MALRLYDILDWIGASEEMRGKHRETAIVGEILETMIHSFFKTDRQGYFVFGSQSEGTTTIGLDSDKDILSCFGIPVVERIADEPEHGLALLIVTDETTKPGYCKLQCIMSRIPGYCRDTFLNEEMHVETDINGRLCLRNVLQVDDEHPNINGPALTSTHINGIVDEDVLKAFQCKHIPSFAKSWLKRVISYNRLNDAQIRMLKESGCFFVGKNHPSSKNGPIEWRLSFSLQERELMSSLNSTQHKCYILLKIIKKDIIHKHVPESISSYHCKTCVLYAVDITPCEFWTRRNRFECTLLCIKLLLHWVKEKYCPNYFMPDENMFDRLEYSTLQHVQTILKDLAEHWCIFLWSLTCDDIGKALHDVLFVCGRSILTEKHLNISIEASSIYSNLSSKLKCIMNLGCLNACKSRSALHLMIKLHSNAKPSS